MKERESLLFFEGIEDGREWGVTYASGDELEYVVEAMELDRGQFANDSMCTFMSAKRGQQMVQVRTTDEGDEGYYWRGFVEGAGEVRDGTVTAADIGA